MITRSAISTIVFPLLSACEHPQKSQTATPAITGAQSESILSIARDLSIQRGMTKLCEGTGQNLLAPFLEDLNTMNASYGLMSEVQSVILETSSQLAREEPEYICTPEMSEDSTTRVLEATRSWNTIKSAAHD